MPHSHSSPVAPYPHRLDHHPEVPHPHNIPVAPYPHHLDHHPEVPHQHNIPVAPYPHDLDPHLEVPYPHNGPVAPYPHHLDHHPEVPHPQNNSMAPYPHHLDHHPEVPHPHNIPLAPYPHHPKLPHVHSSPVAPYPHHQEHHPEVPHPHNIPMAPYPRHPIAPYPHSYGSPHHVVHEHDVFSEKKASKHHSDEMHEKTISKHVNIFSPHHSNNLPYHEPRHPHHTGYVPPQAIDSGYLPHYQSPDLTAHPFPYGKLPNGTSALHPKNLSAPVGVQLYEPHVMTPGEHGLTHQNVPHEKPIHQDNALPQQPNSISHYPGSHDPDYQGSHPFDRPEKPVGSPYQHPDSGLHPFYSGMTQHPDLFTGLSSFPSQYTIFIPVLPKSILRQCINIVEPTLINQCVDKYSDVLHNLARGIKPVSLPHKPSPNASKCLAHAFAKCDLIAKYCINNLLRIYILNPTLIDLSQKPPDLPKEDGPLPETSKRILEKCLKTIHHIVSEKCVPKLYNMLKDVVELGQPKQKLGIIQYKSRYCLDHVFHSCSIAARLETVYIVHKFTNNILPIPVIRQKDHTNVFKTIKEQERALIAACISTIEEAEADSCAPGLYNVLKHISRGVLVVHHVNIRTGRSCLGNVFKNCSFRARLHITDLVKLSTGSLLNIPRIPPSAPPRYLLSDADKNETSSCYVELNPHELNQCMPGLYLIIGMLSAGHIPHTHHVKIFIGHLNCLKQAFTRCSVRSVLIISSLLFDLCNMVLSIPVDIFKDGRLDPYVRHKVRMCFIPMTMNRDRAEHCVFGIYDFIASLAAGEEPKNIHFSRGTHYHEGCVMDLFRGCSLIPRMIINYLIKKAMTTYVNVPVLNIADSYGRHKIDPSMKIYSEVDHELVSLCFYTLIKPHVDLCIPGMYGVLKEFADGHPVLDAVSLKPLHAPCLAQIFHRCSFKSRIVLMDLFHDFCQMNLYIPLKGAPEGFTGNLGPPSEFIQHCLATMDPKDADGCIPRLHLSAYSILLNNLIPHLPPINDTKDLFSCLSKVFRHCTPAARNHIIGKVSSAIAASFGHQADLVGSSVDENVPQKINEDETVKMNDDFDPYIHTEKHYNEDTNQNSHHTADIVKRS